MVDDAPLSEGDHVFWLDSVRKVVAVSADLRDVEGRHIRFTTVATTRERIPDDHVVHERLVRYWLDTEDEFRIIDEDTPLPSEMRAVKEVA